MTRTKFLLLFLIYLLLGGCTVPVPTQPDTADYDWQYSNFMDAWNTETQESQTTMCAEYLNDPDGLYDAANKEVSGQLNKDAFDDFFVAVCLHLTTS